MTNNTVALADLLESVESDPGELIDVALSDITDGVVDADVQSARLTQRLREKRLRRPLLLISRNAGHAPPYKALTEGHLIQAFRQAGLDQLPATVISPEKATALVETLAERFRDTENLLERAWLCDAVDRIADMTKDELGEILGITRRTLHRYQSILDLPPTILRLLVNEQLGLSHALACTKAPSTCQDEMAQVVAKHRLSRRETQDLIAQARRFPGTPLVDLVEETLTSRSVGQAEAAHPLPETNTGVDYTRYISQLRDRRRETLERLAAEMHLDGLTVRRAALLLLADPRLVVPSAVAYAQYVSEKELGRAVAQMELALARMRSAAKEGVTPNERKVLELVLHHVPIWAQELMDIVQQAPVSVGSGPDQQSRDVVTESRH